eukprot:15326033-Alexandrium_andersonii.AAC.1
MLLSDSCELAPRGRQVERNRTAAQPVLRMPGNRPAFPGMLDRNTAQDCRAERRWVDRCVGREVRAVGAPPLQHRVLARPRVSRSQAFTGAPDAHPRQGLGKRAGPPDGLAD